MSFAGTDMQSAAGRQLGLFPPPAPVQGPLATTQTKAPTAAKAATPAQAPKVPEIPELGAKKETLGT